MNTKNTYLEAATTVLKDAGRPMHYEQIAKVAYKRELLLSQSENITVGLNSRLNKEVRENPGSYIVKIRKGIFSYKGTKDE